jgi:hypothetical protein
MCLFNTKLNLDLAGFARSGGIQGLVDYGYY